MTMVRAYFGLIFLVNIFAINAKMDDNMQYIAISRPTYGTNADMEIVVRAPIILDFADIPSSEDLETFGGMDEIAQRLNSMYLSVSDKRDTYIAIDYEICKKRPHVCAVGPSIPILTRNPDIGAICRRRFANVNGELHVWFGQDRFNQCAF